MVRQMAAAWLCTMCSLILLSGPSVAAQKIPDTHSPTLAGNNVNLPADLHGKVGVLVLGFSKKSGDECHVWDDHISRDFSGDPHLVYFEMPVLQDVPGLVRGMIIRGIRNDLTPAARARFLPVVQSESTWKQAAEFGPADDAYVLIVDEAGQVRWRTRGPWSGAAYAAFKTALSAAQK